MSNASIDWSRHPETMTVGRHEELGVPPGLRLYLHKSECNPLKIVYKSYPEQRESQAKPDDDSAVS